MLDRILWERHGADWMKQGSRTQVAANESEFAEGVRRFYSPSTRAELAAYKVSLQDLN